MAIIRDPITSENTANYIATLALLCGITCTILMFRLRGFKATFNVSSGSRVSKEYYEDIPVLSATKGAYRSNREEFFGTGSLSDTPKKIDPSMVKLPASSQPVNTFKPSTSSTDLRQPQFINTPQHLNKSTPNVSTSAQGENRHLANDNITSINSKDAKNQEKERKKLEKERLAEEKRRSADDKKRIAEEKKRNPQVESSDNRNSSNFNVAPTNSNDAKNQEKERKRLEKERLEEEKKRLADDKKRIAEEKKRSNQVENSDNRNSSNVNVAPTNSNDAKNQEKERKRLEKERLAEEKKRAADEKKRLAEEKKREKLAAQQRVKQERERRAKEKLEAQKQAKLAKAKPKAVNQRTNPIAQGSQTSVVGTNPSAQAPVHSRGAGNTNTLESSISRSSGPPPYEATNPLIRNQNDNTGNTSFGKPVDSASGWDMVSQHREQMNRPAVTGGAALKQTVLDLEYTKATGRQSIYI